MDLKAKIKSISSLKLFSELDPEALRLIAFAAETITLNAGDVVFREGEEADGGYVIVSGAIRIDSIGNAVDTGKLVWPGALLGELSLIITNSYSASAIATQKSILIKIPRALFLRVLREFPANAQSLQWVLNVEITTFMKDLIKITIH